MIRSRNFSNSLTINPTTSRHNQILSNFMSWKFFYVHMYKNKNKMQTQLSRVKPSYWNEQTNCNFFAFLSIFFPPEFFLFADLYIYFSSSESLRSMFIFLYSYLYLFLYLFFYISVWLCLFTISLSTHINVSIERHYSVVLWAQIWEPNHINVYLISLWWRINESIYVKHVE